MKILGLCSPNFGEASCRLQFTDFTEYIGSALTEFRWSYTRPIYKVLRKIYILRMTLCTDH